MGGKPKAAFLDFATLGPGIDTGVLDRLLDVTYFPYSTEAEIPARLAGCEVAIVNKVRLSADAIGAARDLRLIVLSATGTDNVDTAAAKRSGIAVANSRDYCTSSVVQHVFALVLCLTQNVIAYDRLSRSGSWSRSRSFALFDHPIRELAGRALGIVGYGTLGRSVAAVARAFGMRVLVSARPKAPADQVPPDRLPFLEVLAEADVLTLHCPLNDETRHMIGAPELARMKPDALLINTARGALVDNAALADALRARRIGGAGIDVLPVEPPDDDQPLLAPDIPNLIVTPHVAWAALEARQRALDQIAENVAAFFAGEELRRVV
ncbi:MAG TPA: NAD(P)-dependent oxidoreductase [Gammaproteobacteria bacterium]